MLIRKFEGESLEKILNRVKKELGPKALVLSTNHKKRALFSKALVEVTAAVMQDSAEEAQEVIDVEKLGTIFPHRRKKEEKAPQNQEKRYVDILEDPSEHSKFSPKLVEKQWLKLGFSPEVAQDLTRELFIEFSKKELENADYFLRAQMKLLEKKITFFSANEVKSKRWLVVGSEGAGKTTTLVKLGLKLKKENEKVGIRSLNNKKVFAKKELFHFSKLLQVSFDKRENTEFWETSQFDSFPEDAESCLWVVDGRMRMEELLQEVEVIRRKVSVEAIAITRADKIIQRGKIWELLKKTRIPLLGINFSNSFESPFLFFNSKSFLKYVLGLDLKSVS